MDYERDNDSRTRRDHPQPKRKASSDHSADVICKRNKSDELMEKCPPEGEKASEALASVMDTFFIPLSKVPERQTTVLKGNFGDMKIMARRMDKSNEKRYYGEVEAHKATTSSNNILQLLFSLKSPSHFYVVSAWEEKCLSSPEVFDTLDYTSRTRLVWGLMQALEQLDKSDLVHTDLNPDHILLRGSGRNLKLIVSNLRRGQVKGEGGGKIEDSSKNWLAPELRNKEVEMFSHSTDVYSGGLLAYFILSRGKTLQDQCNGSLDKSKLNGFDSYCRHLLESMVHEQHKKRPRGRDLVVHPWLWSDEAFLKHWDSLDKFLQRMPNVKDDINKGWKGKAWKKHLYSSYRYNAILKELEDQKKKFNPDYPEYQQEPSGLIRMLRNAQIHFKENREAARISGCRHEILKFIQPKMFFHIFETTHHHYDEIMRNDINPCVCRW